MITRIHLWVILLCSCLVPAPLFPTPQTLQQTLRETAESIHCAASSDEAEYHLHNLQRNKLFPPGVPDESIDKQRAELRASTLDKVLSVLYQSAKKYPSNKTLIEQAVIQWNFCSVIDNGKLFDHYEVNGKSVRSPSAFDKHYHWGGFKAFGLLPATTRTGVFDFTTPYTNTSIRPLADRRLQQTYINHCLPHPDNEHLYRDFGSNFISRVFPSIPNRSPLNETEWNLECKTDVPVLTQATEQPKPQELTTAEQTPQRPPKIVSNTIASDLPLTTINDVAINDQTPQEATAVELPIVAAVAVQPEAETSVPESVVVTIPTDQTEPLFAAAIDAAPEVAPIVVTGPRNGNDIVIPAADNSKGFSGSISLNNSAFDVDNTSLNFAISYKPVRESYWFIRSGFNLSPFDGSDPLTYSWGIGYDDWHPGTWAIQLNHWGPLEPGDGLDLENAVAELSYKVKNSWLAEHNLSSSLALAKPLSSDPTLNWGWSWNPHSHWFIRSTLSKPIGESGLNWSYGFGYTRYNANSLSFEYNNWGPNEFPDLNFKKNALISLIYRWAF